MKGNIFFIILVLSAAGLFAQAGNGWTRGTRTPPDPPTAVTVSGNLAVIDAGIGLKSGDNTYYVMGIDRLIGFVEGLKEGAPVTLEGYEFPLPAAPEYRYFRVLKLSFNGKDYEVSPRLRHLAEGAEFKTWDGPGFPGHGGPRRNFRHHFDRR